MKVYKVLDDKGGAIYGHGKWPLPSENGPGEWLEHKGELIPCKSGLHLCRRDDLLEWLGPTIYLAEYEGEIVTDSNKIVVRKARLIEQLPWNETTARLFAADCAERAVKKHISNPDPRTLEAISVARKFARGEATNEERAAAEAAAEAAARAVAWSSAGVAARAAAWDAERKWQTRRLFEYLDGKRS